MQNLPIDAPDLLLVEDEPADAFLTRIAFEEAGIAVRIHHVGNGREALDFLRRKPPYEAAPRPVLVLLDLNMPRMNGHEFLAEKQGDDALTDLPVVVLTTSDVERDVEACRANGADDYIVKPVDVERYRERVGLLARTWGLPIREAMQ